MALGDDRPPIETDSGGEAGNGEAAAGTAPDGTGDAPSWQDKARALPAMPGVYLFKDRDGKVLYVGKAKDLRVRARSYLKEGGDGRAHVVFLQRRIRDLDYIVTDTEKEALILENNLIKKHAPRYNIQLRDNKTYFHLRLTLSEDYPRLLLARRPKKGGKDLLFGPYSSAGAVKETIRTLQEIFPLRRCKGARFRHRERPCLNHQMGKCLGPCATGVGRGDYMAMVGEVTRFLRGHKPELIDDLRARMLAAAESEEFETAALLRDRIAAIEATLQPQKVDSVKPADRDAIGFVREGDRVAAHRLGFRNGVLLLSESHTFLKVALDDAEVLGSFLGQLYSEDRPPPEEILTPFDPMDKELLTESLGQLRGKRVAVRTPVRGEFKKLVDMAGSNAAETMKRESEKGKDRMRALDELKYRLKLGKRPSWIECVDISILGGEAPVGSVIKFRDGEPDKSGYRLYGIREVEGVNDYGMMKEVLSRRFSRAIEDGEELPDLLVVDGGKGQLNIAVAVLDELGVAGVALAALAKDRETGDPRSDRLRKKGERVFVPGAKDPVNIKQGTAGLFLLQRARDEAHRFAVSGHKRVRGRKARRSSLEDVPGIGPKKARALLRHFGGLAAVRSASAEELSEVKGIGPEDAARVKEHFDK